MKRHTILRTACLGMLLSVCLNACPGTGGSSAWAQEGIPRPSYATDLKPGTRVLILGAGPLADLGLQPGVSGTVVCCDADDCSAGVLVSWNLFRAGGNAEDLCAAAPIGVYPPGSTLWVDPAEVQLGVAFDRIGTLEEGEAGCLAVVTDDGKAYNIVDAAAFRDLWWVVRPGNYVRVRGALNVRPPDPKGEPACPQLDGDIYHPIMSEPHWGTSCCDRWVCGFQYGDRVVLTGDDNPNDAVDLPRGSTGTIMCCNSRDDNAVLVSWDLWANGGDDEEYFKCTERVSGLFPPGSTWWVSPTDIAKEFDSKCGLLKEILFCSKDECVDVNAVGLFVGFREVYYLPDLTADAPLPEDEVRAMGLFTPYGDLPEGGVLPPDSDEPRELTGIVHDAIVVPCPPPAECEVDYLPGDRVLLLVDQPGGAPGLLKGAAGDVLCFNSDDQIAPILVSWDDWTDGHNDDGPCDSPPAGWYPDDSAWWVACTEVKPIVLPDMFDKGPQFRGFGVEYDDEGRPKSLEITGLIGNRGGQDSGLFYTSIYISDDEIITTDDLLLARNAMQIAAGSSIALDWSGKAPADLPDGIYTIGWIIDAENRVEEADKTNNTAVIEDEQLVVPEPLL